MVSSWSFWSFWRRRADRCVACSVPHARGLFGSLFVLEGRCWESDAKGACGILLLHELQLTFSPTARSHQAISPSRILLQKGRVLETDLPFPTAPPRPHRLPFRNRSQRLRFGSRARRGRPPHRHRYPPHQQRQQSLSSQIARPQPPPRVPQAFLEHKLERQQARIVFARPITSRTRALGRQRFRPTFVAEAHAQDSQAVSRARRIRPQDPRNDSGVVVESSPNSTAVGPTEQGRRTVHGDAGSFRASPPVQGPSHGGDRLVRVLRQRTFFPLAAGDLTS